MKILVTYGSEYGSAEKYARWLGEELGAEVCSSKAVKPEQLSKCDVIIHGGGLYAGAVKGLEVISGNAALLQGKRVAVFTVGVGELSDPANIDSIREGIAKKLTGKQLPPVEIFHLRGDMNYDKMSTLHRMMMWMLRRVLSRKAEGERSETDRLVIGRKNLQAVNKASLAPILVWAREE